MGESGRRSGVARAILRTALGDCLLLRAHRDVGVLALSCLQFQRAHVSSN